MGGRAINDVGSALESLEKRMQRMELRRRGFATTVVTSLPTYAQDTPPTGTITTGAIWYDTSNNNTAYRWSGSSWVPVIDPSVDAGRDQAATDLINAQDDDGSPDKHITTYVQANPPAVAPVGDLWVDTDNNHLYRSNGVSWVDTGDTSVGASIRRPENASTIADGRTQTWYANNPPTPDGFGDTWVDTSQNPEALYRWNNYNWVQVSGWSLEQVNAKVDTKTATFRQGTVPTSITVGDVWYDTASGNKEYRAETLGANSITAAGGGGWIVVQDTSIKVAQDTADSKIKTFRQTTVPTSVSIGDVWYDTDDGNKQYRANAVGVSTIVTSGNGWYLVQDAAIDVIAGDVADLKTDGNPPTTSPTPAVIGGISAIYLNWTPPANNDPLTYDIYCSSEPNFTASNQWLVMNTESSSVAVKNIALNLIPNPGARVGANGWLPGFCAITQSNEAAYGGTVSFRLAATGTNAPFMYTPQGLDGFPVVAGVTYHLAARVRAGIGFTGNAGINANWYNAAGVALTPSIGATSAVTANGWTLVTNDVTAPAGAAYVAVATGMSGTVASQAIFYIDGVEMLDPTRTGTFLAEMPYYFRVNSRDADGPCLTPSPAITGTLKLADNEEISTEYLYAGDITVDQIRGGTASFDYTLSATISTGVTGQNRVEISPEGINLIHPATGGGDDVSAITLPTDPNQTATFKGELTADSITVLDGLEIRGKKNTFARGSITTLQTQITGSSTPPGVIVDYPTADWGGTLSNVYLQPYGVAFGTDGTYVIATRFYDTGGITYNGNHYDFPILTATDGKKRASFTPDGGVVWVYDSSVSKYVAIFAGFNQNTTRQIRKYDLTPMLSGGAPTLLSTYPGNVPWQASNVYLTPHVAQNFYNQNQFIYYEMTYERKLRVVFINANTMTSASSFTFTQATPINEYTVPTGLVFGPANKLGLHDTDTQNVWALCVNVGDAAQRPNGYVYAMTALGNDRVSEYDFMASGLPFCFAGKAVLGTTGQTFNNFVSTVWGSPMLTEYTNIHWTTEGSYWYAGYTWYGALDSPNLETNMSVSQPFTMKKHARVSISTPPLPDPEAGADTIPVAGDVTGVQVYLGRSTTTTPPTTPSGFWRQNAQASDASNMEINPSFESATTGWAALAGNTIARSTAQFQSGVASLALTTTTAGTVGAYNDTPGYMAVTPTYVYSASSWLRGATTARASFIRIEWLNSSGTLVGTTLSASKNTVASTWGWLYVAGVAPASAAFARVMVTVNASTVGEIHYIDQVVFARGTNGAQISSQPLFGAPSQTPPAASNFDTTGAAFLQSSSTNTTTHLPKFQLDGQGNAHFENLDVSGGGVATIAQLIVTSSTDATNTAGNTPPLRIGSITGTHLRVDGNEIIAMLSNTSQGSLILNAGGTTSCADVNVSGAMLGTTNFAGAINVNSGACTMSAAGNIGATGNIVAQQSLYTQNPDQATAIPNIRLPSTTGGDIRYTSHANSSVRYKKEIQELELTEEQLYGWRGIEYELKKQPIDRPKDFKFWGLVAEELESLGFESLIERDEEGQVDVVDYAKMCVVQQQAIRHLHDRLKRLEGRDEE